MEYWDRKINPGYPCSGWKLQLYGKSESDSKFLYSILKSFLIENKLGCKISTRNFFEVTNGKKQEGKSAIIYFSGNIKNYNLEKIVSGIRDLLTENNYKKDKQIFGSKKLTNSVYYRFQMKVPEKKNGFYKEDFKIYYRKSDRDYNIKNNSDPFEGIKI